jgi:DnaK suppressor protein
MDESRKDLYTKCRVKLLKLKQERMNSLRAATSGLQDDTMSGDEGDMALGAETQHASVIQSEKILNEIREIDMALQRIEEGTYGICEETGDVIEGPRLMAIPWTRLSLEGAETRERMRKKFA